MQPSTKAWGQHLFEFTYLKGKGHFRKWNIWLQAGLCYTLVFHGAIHEIALREIATLTAKCHQCVCVSLDWSSEFWGVVLRFTITWYLWRCLHAFVFTLMFWICLWIWLPVMPSGVLLVVFTTGSSFAHFLEVLSKKKRLLTKDVA